MSCRTRTGISALACMLCLAFGQLLAGPPAHAQSTAALAAKARPSAAPGGFLKSITGPVYIRHGDVGEVSAKVGDVLLPDTRVRAGSGAQAVLLFADGQNVTLGKDSTVRVDDYHFDPASPKASRANIVLLNGFMRVVTGEIHTRSPEALKIRAGRSTVTVTSKDLSAFVIQVDGKKNEHGVAGVIVGEIAVRTPYGEVRRIASDQFGRWQPERGLTPPLPIGAAPAVFQAQMAAASANVEGSTTPIDVQSAAVQAALALKSAGSEGKGSNVAVAPLSGQLNMVVGTVLLRSASGSERQARIGDNFGPGSTISTSGDARAGLLFSEGQYAALEANSVLQIAGAGTDKPGTAPGGAPLGLLSGRMSFVTWAAPLDHPAGMTIAAGNAFISVAGKGVTAFVVEVGNDTRDLAVTAGSVSLQTLSGPSLTLVADQFTSWQVSSAPAPAQPLAKATEGIVLAFTNAIINAPRNAEVAAEIAGLPPTGAGPTQTQPQPQPQIVSDATQPQQPTNPPPPSVSVPAVSPGGGGGCVGSPC